MKEFESFPMFIIDEINNKHYHFEVPAEMLTADALTWEEYFEPYQEMLDSIKDALSDAIENYVHEHPECSCTLDELDRLIEEKESD